jgi:hypothetical protein
VAGFVPKTIFLDQWKGFKIGAFNLINLHVIDNHIFIFLI